MKPGPCPQHIHNIIVGRIKKFRKQGMCTRDIAERVGCSASKVRRVVRAGGLPPTSEEARAAAISRGQQRRTELFGEGGGARTASVRKKWFYGRTGWQVMAARTAIILDTLYQLKESSAEKVALALGFNIRATRTQLYRLRMRKLVTARQILTERNGRGALYRVSTESKELHERWLYERKEG